jgi:molybdate transport system substrate-binding protein
MQIRKWRFKLACLLVIPAMFGVKAAVGAESQKITVFAAASTTNAVTEIAKLFEKSHPVVVRLSFASSSTLAKQIEKGAPADILLSANPKWMDYLAGKGAIVASSRTDLLGNRIVLIAPRDSSLGRLTVDRTLNLANLLGEGRLAMGDPDHVPAGIYGKQALEKLGLWDSVKDQVARAKDVRAALVLVERGETPLGEVYATDAAISDKVKIVGMFPEDSHPPIIYPVAVTADSKNAAAGEFIKFLQSAEAKAVFEKYGFSVR